MMKIWISFWLIAFSCPLYGWGTEGHELTCAIADAKLTPKARQFVKDTLSMGQFLDGNSDNDLASACLWADDAKYAKYAGTYESHFLNVPRSENKIEFSRDCAALDCIAVGIQRNLNYLAQTATSDRERARKAAALRFLGHFIGDLHQPLHVSNLEDWGGNKIKVSWFGKKSNLHKVWDVEVLERSGLSHPDNLDFFLRQEIDDHEFNVLRWMESSFKLARSSAYRNADGNIITTGETLNEAYFEKSKPVVIQQLLLAGHRLAYLINSLADSSLDPNILIN